MRYFTEHIYGRIMFILVLSYALFLNWSPFINSFLAYTLAGFLVLRVFLIEPREVLFLKRADFYLFSMPVFFYLIGILYSSHPHWRELGVVSPLIAFAAVFTTNKPLTKLETRRVLIAFILSTTLCAIVNFTVYVFSRHANADIRQMSLFMSHIRFSLFVNIAIFSCIYYLFFRKDEPLTKIERYIFIYSLFILFPYLFIQQSLSGIVTFCAVVTFISIKSAFRSLDSRLRIMLRIIVGIIIIAIGSVAYEAHYFLFPHDDTDHLPQLTLNGNAYTHSYRNSLIENGHYVLLYICDKEIESEWPRRSKLSTTNVDARKQAIYGTIIRYLTSKNLTKDSAGIAQLTDEDIANIERGVTNYRFSSELRPNKKIYTFLWEIHSSYIGSNPVGHSAMQRMVFISAGFKLVADHPWFGVGTSMPTQALRPYYEKMNQTLPQRMWYGPHNQFMSFAVMFGLVGLGTILLSYVLLIRRTRAFRSYFKGMYFIILALSMLVEDSISTQAGVILYGLFGGLFLFGTEDDYLF